MTKRRLYNLNSVCAAYNVFSVLPKFAFSNDRSHEHSICPLFFFLIFSKLLEKNYENTKPHLDNNVIQILLILLLCGISCERPGSY